MFALFDSVSDRLTITSTKRFSLSDFLKSIFGYSIIEKKRYLTFFIALYFVLSQTVIQLKNVRKTKYMNKMNQKSTLKVISLISQGGPTCLLAWERTI